MKQREALRSSNWIYYYLLQSNEFLLISWLIKRAVTIKTRGTKWLDHKTEAGKLMELTAIISACDMGKKRSNRLFVRPNFTFEIVLVRARDLQQQWLNVWVKTRLRSRTQVCWFTVNGNVKADFLKSLFMLGHPSTPRACWESLLENEKCTLNFKRYVFTTRLFNLCTKGFSNLNLFYVIFQVLMSFIKRFDGDKT